MAKKHREFRQNILVLNKETGLTQTLTPHGIGEVQKVPKQYAKIEILGFADKGGELIEGSKQDAINKYSSKKPIVDAPIKAIETLKRNVDMGRNFNEKELSDAERKIRSEEIDL
jgi:hypothetical protein